MKNVLILGIRQSALNNVVLDTVLKKTDVQKLFLLLHEKKDEKIFAKYGKCFFREDIARGDFANQNLDMVNCIPLDDTVFSNIAVHIFEILNQQRRFEEYHAFHISKEYDSHYTIFMRNLFFWNNLLETEKITHVFFSCLPHEGYDSIIYHLCKMKKIAVRMIYNATLPRRYYVLSDYMDLNESLGSAYQKLCDEYKDQLEIPLDEVAEKLYQKWTSLEPAKMKPWYMEGNPLKRRFVIRFGETNLLKVWEQEIGNIYVKYDYKPCLGFIGECLKNIPRFVAATVDGLKRWHYSRPVWKRTLELNEYYDSIAESPAEGERYIYFALHYQPEASSNPLGGREYVDQIFAIHLLARSVPKDMKIYVKVHPEQLAPLRSKEYYDDIKRINGVRLIKSECSTYDLIQKSFAVSSLTGTVCWEAQFFGIPAILFGYSHKNLAPLSYPVRTWEECRQAIASIERKHKKTSHRELRILLKAMYDNSFPEEIMSTSISEIIVDFLR